MNVIGLWQLELLTDILGAISFTNDLRASLGQYSWGQ